VPIEVLRGGLRPEARAVAALAPPSANFTSWD